MSQCPGTPATVLEGPLSWEPLDATPFHSQHAPSVEPSLGQLSPRSYKRRVDLRSDPSELQTSFDLPCAQRRRLSSASLGSTRHLPPSDDFPAPSTALSEVEVLSAPVVTEEEEDIGDLPQPGRCFRRKGRCYLLTYSQFVKSEDTLRTSRYEVIKGLVDFLYSLKGKGGGSLIEYAVGVTESHDLAEGQWHPDWHCHVLIWGREVICSESLNLYKFKGVRPHERLLALRNDKGGFPPLSAYKYMQKEALAWESRYGNLTEEFLSSQDPSAKKMTPKNEDFVYAMEAPTEAGFFDRLRERQPRDLAMGFNSLKAFAAHLYKDTGALPAGVCAPKELKKGTINLPPEVMPWVTSNILERDPEADCGKILILHGKSSTGKSAFARSLGHHIQLRQDMNLDKITDHPMVKYAVLDDMDWSKVHLKMWVQEDFNFRTSYRAMRKYKWGRSTIICSNTKPLVFADCSYHTAEGKDWIDTNCTFVEIDLPLY